jgi:hypothetical protein
LPPEDAAYPWWRVSIVGPNTLNIDLEMRAAWSVSDWGRFARRHYGQDATVLASVRPDPGMPAETEELKEFFEEKTGILECARLPKPKAEAEAARLVATLARNRSCSWASLRTALADYPDLLAQLLDRAGKVDGLPWDVATVAVLKGRLVLRQGAFVGPHHVTTTREDQR